MEVEWDPKKAKANYLKHIAFFSDAETVFYDPHALSQPDPDSEGEPRFIATGCDSLGRILTVIYTYQNENLRLISARKATKKERQCYEKRV